jgi:hypothetical protein
MFDRPALSRAGQDAPEKWAAPGAKRGVPRAPKRKGRVADFQQTG